jgi:hypothetical protein
MLFGLLHVSHVPRPLATLLLWVTLGGGFAASFRVPDHALGLRAADGTVAASPRWSRITRGVFIAAGLLTYPVVLAFGWSESPLWLVAWGLASVAAAAAIASGSRAAVRAFVPLVWVPMLLLLPLFGIGLFLAPAALGVGVAALVPDRPPSFGSLVPSARRILWVVVLLLIALGLIGLGSPVASVGS